MSRLKDRIAIVTGAASGIGRATAKLYAAEGASVVIADKADGVHETAKDIQSLGGKALSFTGDTGEEGFVASLVEHALSRFGQLDIAYANAGITGGGTPWQELTADIWAEVLRVNLIGPFLMIKHAAPVMAGRGKGSIICTASVAGIRSGAGPVPYSASKAGVMNLVATMANELYGSGVRVNAICPGLIETGMTKFVFDAARAKGSEGRIGQLNPLGRYGVPEEIAGAALFLASDDSSYVNGQALAVDGGLSSSHPVVRKKREGLSF